MTTAWKHLDPFLTVLTLVATALGLFFIFDAGYAQAIQGNKGTWPPEFRTQIIVVLVAAPIGLLASMIRPESWLRFSKIAWLVILVLLGLVELFGHELNGAKRWIGVGPASIQPAEFAKLAAILYLAGLFAVRKPWVPRKTKGWTKSERLDRVVVPKVRRLLPAVWIGLGVVLIAFEPDLGTAAVIAATAFAMFLPGGVSKACIAAALCLSVIVGAVFIRVEPYRMQRIVNHTHRWEKQNVDDIAYQSIQSELSEAYGGVTGVGIGAGRAKHVLPEATTDFVMATVAEEFGLLGALAVLATLGGLVWRLYVLAQRAESKFSKLVLFGVGSWIGVQATVNVMMANAFLPAIGIPVPFISYGGSSLVALWAAMGICHSVLAPSRVEEAAYAPGTDRWRHRRPHLSRA